MNKKSRRAADPFGTSFMDVLANTIGGLAFLLVMAAIMIGFVVFSPPVITTEKIPDAYHGTQYEHWLGAREGLGRFEWTFSGSGYPEALELDPLSGRLHGNLRLAPEEGETQTYQFKIKCRSLAEGSEGQPTSTEKEFDLMLRREAPFKPIPLKITSQSSLPDTYRGKSYPLVFGAEGGQPPYRWESRSELPEGLTISPLGELQGKPTKLGKFQFKIAVITATGETESKNFTLTVSENYPPPPPIPPLSVVTTQIPNPVALNEYVVFPAAEGGEPPYQWEFVGVSPAWLKGEGRKFTGTPALPDIGEFNLHWQVRDSAGRSAKSKSIPSNVLPAPGPKPPPLRLRTTQLPKGRVSESYGLELAAEGGYPPYTWEGTLTGLNGSGLTFNIHTGTIEGVPKKHGQLFAAIKITDRVGQSDSSQPMGLTVEPARISLRILTKSLPRGRVGAAYDISMAGTGGFAPYNWTLNSGTLPKGIRLNPTSGILEGTPQETGFYQFGVVLTDSVGTSTPPFEDEIEILNRRDLRPLVITTTSVPELRKGIEIEQALACKGGELPYKWTAEGLPGGLEISDGRVRGVPLRSGLYTVALAVRDSSGDVAEKTIEIKVTSLIPWWWAATLLTLLIIAALMIWFLSKRMARNQPEDLKITTQSIPNARASMSYEVQLACRGGRPPYQWSLASGELPNGLQLNEEGLIHGTPFEGILVDETKEAVFEIEVKDQLEQTDRMKL